MIESVIVACVDIGEAYEIKVDDKLCHFDWHRYSGPQPANRNGATRRTSWPKKVWEAVQLWSDQGKRVDPAGPSSNIWTGLCLYDEPDILKSDGEPCWYETEEGSHIQVGTDGQLLRGHASGYGGDECELCMEGGGDASD